MMRKSTLREIDRTLWELRRRRMNVVLEIGLLRKPPKRLGKAKWALDQEAPR